jgi:hypothetical protein
MDFANEAGRFVLAEMVKQGWVQGLKRLVFRLRLVAGRSRS